MRRRFLGWFLALVLSAGAGLGQTPQADKIRQQVGKIGVLGNITVDVQSGPKYYGSVSWIGADDFSISEVDQQREITLQYERREESSRGLWHYSEYPGAAHSSAHWISRDAGGGGRAADAGVRRGGVG